ncbi:hypothetical protein [Fluviicola taffensis]|uniref:Lipoprotein n=1 Tax=Fluviicola taffensis (strain DSM 16823 / NCIMB 13979 / RW262) TaxID=755732 RepID=F2IIV6_FLUTR|nr:hypothetical protein [Fluviicola taffensis]AEA42813.1 hypothetical protein Fluta_0810 [Fluviicola taffensis DSM 16823]
MKTVLFLASCILLSACSSSSIKENINKAGDAAGQTAGEFIEGASKGVQKAFDVNITIDSKLAAKGIECGKTQVASDSLGTDNLLIVYVIFNENFKGKLTAKAFDDNSLEMGRSSVQIQGKKDEAKYVEFHFDPRTNLDSKHQLTVE